MNERDRLMILIERLTEDCGDLVHGNFECDPGCDDGGCNDRCPICEADHLLQRAVELLGHYASKLP
jgi:hypothetical protein